MRPAITKPAPIEEKMPISYNPQSKEVSAVGMETHSSKYLQISLIGLLTLSCSITDEVVCTASLVPGLVVEVIDAESGAVVSDLWGYAQDGMYVDSMYIHPGSDGPLLLAPEREGVYNLSISKNGYSPWTMTSILVEGDGSGCHVKSVELIAELQKL